jgi:hypothetical protein
MATPQYFKTVDVASLRFDSLRKDGRIYSAPLQAGPLRIQSPPVVIKSLIEGVAWLVPTGPFKSFLEEVEAHLKAKSLMDAASWGLQEDQVRTSFKSFFRAEDGAFKVRVHPEFASFSSEGDLLEEPCEVKDISARVILELEKLSLGKTEMGGLWRLVQLRVSPTPPPCLIDFDVEVPDDEEDAAQDQDDDEFV